MRLKISHDFTAVRQAASQVRSFLQEHGLRDEEIWACELALVEGCNNAVQYVPPSAMDKEILLEVSCNPERVDVKIQDHTEGFEMPGALELPDPDRENGRGLYLIKSLMDEVEYVREQSSNCLLLQKRRTGI